MADDPIDAIKNPKIEDVKPEELAVAFSGPAFQVNKFFINITPSGVRIAFTELNPGFPPLFRTAVNLSVTDAYALAGVLRGLLDRSVVLEAVQAPNTVAVKPAEPKAE